MFAAVSITPSLITAGKPQPTGPSHPASRTTSTAVETIASGVAGGGVLILTLSMRNSPDSTSTGAPLIPEPPTSNPKTFMRPPQTDAAIILYDPNLPPEPSSRRLGDSLMQIDCFLRSGRVSCRSCDYCE